MDKVYLGDGVYAAFDGCHIVLTTENGVRVTNTIYLEPSVLFALDRYRAEPAAPAQTEGGGMNEPRKRLAAKQEMERATESIARRMSAERMGTGALWELFLVEAYQEWFAAQSTEEER